MIEDCVNFALERKDIGFVAYGSRAQIARLMDARVAAGERVSMYGFKRWNINARGGLKLPTWRMLACSINWEG